MKDAIQGPGNEVSIVIYDAPLPPKYFRLSKKFIRAVCVTLPLLLCLFFVALFIWGLLSRTRTAPRPAFPEILTEQDSKIIALEAQLQDLQSSNRALADKLATQPSTAVEDPFLMTIKRPYGMQNLMQENRVTLDNIEMIQEQGKTVFKFHIINAAAENRVTGHVLVYMVSEAGAQIWPKEARPSLTSGIKYTLGDSFAVSRLRPTSAEFPVESKDEQVKFIVYIFNREGDLLLLKETPPFKGDPKT